MEHRETEAAIRASGVPATIRRNGWYTESFMGQVPAALDSGVYHGSAGDGRIATPARPDYEQAMVEVLLDDDHIGRTHELAGDERFTLAGLCEELSHESGRTVRLIHPH